MPDTYSTLALGKALEAAGDYTQALATYLAAFQTGAAGGDIEALLFREDFLVKTYPHSIRAFSLSRAARECADMAIISPRVREERGL